MIKQLIVGDVTNELAATPPYVGSFTRGTYVMEATREVDDTWWTVYAHN